MLQDNHATFSKHVHTSCLLNDFLIPVFFLSSLSADDLASYLAEKLEVIKGECL